QRGAASTPPYHPERNKKPAKRHKNLHQKKLQQRFVLTNIKKRWMTAATIRRPVKALIKPTYIPRPLPLNQTVHVNLRRTSAPPSPPRGKREFLLPGSQPEFSHLAVCHWFDIAP
ncbi:unnamed protein product, partial [Ectocarpus sp. 13 AM-2016]